MSSHDRSIESTSSSLPPGSDDLKGDLLDREVPHVFDVLLSGVDGHIAATVTSLDGDPDVVRWSRTDLAAGQVRLRVSSIRMPRTAALGRILSTCRYCGLTVVEVRPEDSLSEVSDAWLERQVHGQSVTSMWDRVLEHPDTYRRRLESLEGSGALEQLLRIVQDASESWEHRNVAAYSCGYVLLNSPELTLARRVIAVAAEQAGSLGWRNAFPKGGAIEHLVDGVSAMFAPWSPPLIGLPNPLDEPRPAGDSLDESPLRDLLAHPWGHLSWRALILAASLPGRREPETAEVIARIGIERALSKGQDAGVVNTAAAAALAVCPGTPAVLQALELLRHADQTETRLTAANALASLGGPAIVRSLWEEWLGSRSPVERWVACDLLAEHGSGKDVQAAVGALRMTLASSLRGDPPRGTELIEFLARQDAVALAGPELDKARRRKAGVDPHLEAWLAQHQPNLAGPAAP